MLFQTKSKTGEVSNVKYINGIITFSNIKLNVYCFEVDGVLIDTGSPRLLKEFRPFFNDADVDQVVITHFHEDHNGGAAYLQNELNLPIYMNEMTLDDSTHKADYPLYRQMFWGRRRPFQALPIGGDITSRNANWDVIHTPGHAEDHLSFLNRETGQLFSGDLFVHTRTNVMLRDESVPTIIESIESVLHYDFDELYCCHAGYVKDGRKALTKKLHFLKEIQEKILTLQKEGNSEREIQAKLFKKKYPITYFSFGEWDSIHIIRSVMKS